MVKVTHPLHSLAATGTIAKVITFRSTKRGSEAHTKPAASRSHKWKQLQRRMLYALGCTAWNELPPMQKANWRSIGAPAHITGFNAFVQNYLETEPLPPLTIWDGGVTYWDAGFTVWLG